MSERFNEEEIQRILGEAARIAVEKVERENHDLSYEDIEAAATESGIDAKDLAAAMERFSARLILVRDETGQTHARKLAWKDGEPGKWLKYSCPFSDCALRSRCPVARWENVITGCDEVYRLKPSLGAVLARPTIEGPLVRTSPNGCYVLFAVTYGPLVESLFGRLARDVALRCQEALGVLDLAKKQAGLLLASAGPIEPHWTGPATFRVQLQADLVSISGRGARAKLFARLPDRSSQIFLHLGADPASRVFTRVDAYQIEA